MPSLSTFDGQWTEAKPHGSRRVYYPFDGDNESFYIEQDYMQALASWEALALDTTHDDFPDLYLVRESPLLPLGGGIVQWTRTYARIPNTRSESQSFAYTVPGVAPDVVPVAKQIDPTTPFPTTYLITSTAHGFSVDDVVVFSYAMRDPTFPNIIHQRNQSRVIRSVDSATQFSVDLVSDAGPLLNWGYVVKGITVREPDTKIVASWIQYDYFLPGVSVGIASPNDIPLFEPIRIIDASGNETDTYTNTTNPNAAQYYASVQARELVVAEPSILRRWMGNIYERATRYIVAQ